MTANATRPAGRILVDQLLVQGVQRVFCVPGESYLPVLDALFDHHIDVVTCRQEGGAAMMAEAHGKLTGRPGVCIVTRGPGATNASIGVHIARQDSSPMLLLVGQVGRDQRDREAFQEIDLVAMFRPLAKWAAEVDSAERIPEYFGRAFHCAISGRPGPVMLALPEDMLHEAATVADVAAATRPPLHPDPASLARLESWLERAAAPLVVVGATGWSGTAAERLQAWAGDHGIPVASAFRCQDAIDNTHPCYWGHLGLGMDPQLANSVRDCDLLVMLGARLDEVTTGAYRLIGPAADPRRRLVHVHPDLGELGSLVRPDLALAADPEAVVEALTRMAPTASATRAQRLRLGHKRYLDYSEPGAPEPGLDPAGVIACLRERLPADAILTNGAGNYAIWLHRFFRYRGPGTQLAPRAGAMGYGLPAALAAKALYPERPVVCLAGDGCLMMTAQELATAAQHRLGVVVIVFNNQGFGTIRMHQERHYPGRPVATALDNPDFTDLARACGLTAWRSATNEEFEAALDEALSTGGPCLIEVAVDPQLIAPGTRLAGGQRKP